MPTYLASWNEIQKYQPEKNTMVAAGKALWNLGLKGLVKRVHNFFSKPKSVEAWVDRHYMYETMFDNLDPTNTDTSLFQNLAKVKEGVDTIKTKFEVKPSVTTNDSGLLTPGYSSTGPTSLPPIFADLVDKKGYPPIFTELGGGSHVEGHELGTGLFSPPSHSDDSLHKRFEEYAKHSYFNIQESKTSLKPT